MTEPTKTLLMTGASRGLGRAAAERLLRDRPDQLLLVLVRGEEAGHRLARDLAARTGNANVRAAPCDLGSLAEVRAAAETVRRLLDEREIPPLTGVLANAGVQMASATKATADGFEATFGINVLANYLLLRLLADRLEPGARVVITGSESHFGDFRHNMGLVPAPRWTDPQSLAKPSTGPEAETVSAGRRAYATSKLGVQYLVHALARRLPGIDVYAYTPGLVPGTGLVRDASAIQRFGFRWLLPLLWATPIASSPQTAGAKLAAAMTAPRPAESGAYLDRGRVVPSSEESYDEEREEELWQHAAELCGVPVGT
ncbi:NAD(P)-dependent dehydrogenase, short-chain alcohol dehydrogenase family [Amycolatopsis tolypomycina]|uniref:NAD(P)-dependent dehydrogenase, short-chain alcohol dehydrogenase family n=1 Tax=Amycolatopsis tolypomycina TaxID=208445 RepID=A0A1H4IUT4_9PSEU|nr:SDR family NAD(P)-dependent oxidoreductase [Amycolatopsis tolypomycina]SEB37891.1 NAD(P)-dependent dehydrogenase, short-chain alcohol dehydrogenase family [Amycolatopsis tolypomycina]